MTKKEEKAREIEAKRLASFGSKARTLLAHVAVNPAEVVAAFRAGRTAEDFAAEVAAREPVGKALHPAKAEAVAAAEADARKTVAKVRQDLIEHGWDIVAAAPYPRYNMPEYERRAQVARHQLFTSVTKDDPAKGYQIHNGKSPRFVIIDDEGVARFVRHAGEDAALYYDAFIVKMVGKVGKCDTAEIDGSHVWAHSILTVRKGADVERWKTQQIWNVSKLGTNFPQWPSRLVK